MININVLSTSGIENAVELADMASEATHFLQWHHWCKKILHGYLDRGWAGMVAVFYFEIETASASADETLWVIVGDIPPAYIDTYNCPNGVAALNGYVDAMQEWVDLVNAGQPLQDVIPVYRRYSFVEVKPSDEYASMLASRLMFIRSDIIPIYQNSQK